MTKPKIFIFPGNGNSHIDTDNWYAWVRDELRRQGYEVFANDMPDPLDAHANIWIPYIARVIGGDQKVILVGHSSGAVAILRYLETYKVFGAILVGVNYTDLGFPEEKESGYYSDPWQWDKIKKNVDWIAQFTSRDDPYISEMESRHIHAQLGTKYYEYPGRGHFMVDDNPVNNKFPELMKEIEVRAT